MMLSMDQDKAILHPPIDFIIPNEFNEMVEHKACLFLVLPKVLQELMEEFLFLKHFQNSKTNYLHPSENDVESENTILCWFSFI